MSDKEKAVKRTLRAVSPYLIRKLNGQEVAVELYGRDMLTSSEYESLRVEADTVKANRTLMSILERRGENAIDALLEALNVEAVANKAIIDKIKEGN